MPRFARLMRVTAIALAVPLLAGAFTLASCRSATEIDVVVTTDFTCNDLKHVTGCGSAHPAIFREKGAGSIVGADVESLLVP
jgi:hypothetical protein